MSDIYSIIDIETTGGVRDGNKITEIAIINFDGEKIIEEFSTLINPERSIPYSITRLTGISNDMVVNAPKFYEVAKKIIEMTENNIFVAHNVFFDYNFIKREFQELGYTYNREKLCTVRLARKFLPNHQSYSLGSICADLGIEISARHRALGDAKATVELFKKINSNCDITSFKTVESKKVCLPKEVNRDEYDALPNKIGLYYFYDQQGTLLYIGKSKDIKKRVTSHFRPDVKRRKDLDLKNKISKIDYKVIDQELIALLLECFEIKKYRPPFNYALRRRRTPYSIDLRKDNHDVLYLKIVTAEDDANNFCFGSKHQAQRFANSIYMEILGHEEGSLQFESEKDKIIRLLGLNYYNKTLEEKFLKKKYELDNKLLNFSNGKFQVLINSNSEVSIKEKDNEINLGKHIDYLKIISGYISKHNLKAQQIK